MTDRIKKVELSFGPQKFFTDILRFFRVGVPRAFYATLITILLAACASPLSPTGANSPAETFIPLSVTIEPQDGFEKTYEFVPSELTLCRFYYSHYADEKMKLEPNTTLVVCPKKSMEAVLKSLGIDANGEYENHVLLRDFFGKIFNFASKNDKIDASSKNTEGEIRYRISVGGPGLTTYSLFGYAVINANTGKFSIDMGSFVIVPPAPVDPRGSS